MSKFTKTEGTQAIWDALSEGTYDNDETTSKAYDKAMKEAKEFDLYVTELA